MWTGTTGTVGIVGALMMLSSDTATKVHPVDLGMVRVLGVGAMIRGDVVCSVCGVEGQNAGKTLLG
jgi:hypothetical protein